MPVNRVRKLPVPRTEERFPKTGAADAKPTALIALEQHDGDQRKGDHQVNDQKDLKHVNYPIGGGRSRSARGHLPVCVRHQGAACLVSSCAGF